MCVVKTGFWCAPDVEGVDFHLYWARWSGSDKRSELWELSVVIDGENSRYVWTDVSARFREYGFLGYLGALKFQGYTCSQQPNGYTRNLTEMPRLPYPEALLSGTRDESDGWTFEPGMNERVTADNVGIVSPDRWTIRVADVPAGSDDDVQGLPLPGLHDDFFTPRDLVAIADGDYGDVWDDETSPTAEEIAEYEADVLAIQAADVAADDGGVVEAEPVEPEPVTAEIPEMPPKTTMFAVSYATLPDLMPVRDCPELYGLGRIRPFRTSKGRKVAYVASFNGKCVVAYRGRYARGSDKVLEKAVADYVAVARERWAKAA